MYTTAIVSALAASLSLTSAAPASMEKRDVCAGTQEFPWFVNPQPTTACDTPQTVYPVSSGPPPGAPQTCVPLDPNNIEGTFPAASINTPCTDYPYNVSFYTTDDCSDEPVAAISGACTIAPGAPFLRFSALNA